MQNFAYREREYYWSGDSASAINVLVRAKFANEMKN